MTFKSKLIINTLYDNDRGPGMVYKNLIKGLIEIDYSYLALRNGQGTGNFQLDDRETFVGSLQAVNYTDAEIDLFGPNCFVMPRELTRHVESIALINSANSFVVPSQWVKDKYLHYDANVIAGRPIHIWASGIDTEKFKPKAPKRKIDSIDQMKVMIYFKNRTDTDYEAIVNSLKLLGVKEENIFTLNYGAYSQQLLLDVCEIADAAIILANTESQGIANLEILSMNVPCFFVDQTKWTYEVDPKIVWEAASSMPYFNMQMGALHSFNPDFIEQMKGFLMMTVAGIFAPRQYILENFSLAKKARDYVSLIEPKA